MNILLVNKMPDSKKGERIAAVYKIQFDNGFFYIGASINVRFRFLRWRRVLAVGSKDKRHIWPSFINKITGSKTAEFDILHRVANTECIHEEEERFLISEKNNPLLINIQFRPKIAIVQYDLEGREVARHESMEECIKTVGLYTRSLQDVLNGRKRTSKGFIFMYENPELRPLKRIERKSRKRSLGRTAHNAKKINKFNSDGVLLETFDSIRIAQANSKINGSDFRRHIRGKKYFNGIKGFIYRYA